MNTNQVSGWIDGYVRAWTSNDPQEIGGLFSEGARYFTSPFSAPWQGREGIVKGWLNRKDDPGGWRFRYEVLAMDGNTALVRGWTQYLEPAREYANLWVIRFDPAGRCEEFTEWWMKRA